MICGGGGGGVFDTSIPDFDDPFFAFFFCFYADTLLFTGILSIEFFVLLFMLLV